MGTTSSKPNDGRGSSGGNSEKQLAKTTVSANSNTNSNNNQNDITAVHGNNDTSQQLALVPSSQDASTANSTHPTQSTAVSTIPTSTATATTKTNDGGTTNKNQNLTPSVVDNISHTPIPNESAKGVADLADGILSTASATSPTSSPTLDSTKKDLNSKFSTADNTTTTASELEGVLRVVINEYYVNGESGIDVDYLRDLSVCCGKKEGHNVRLVKAAINILADIDEGSINNDTSDPSHIQQKSRKRSVDDAAVSNIPIRADSDNVSSQVGELQHQLSLERDGNRQFMAQATASVKLLERFNEADSAILNRNINTLEDTVAKRDARIQELEEELNNTPAANQYIQIIALENEVAERNNQITELRDELATQEASHQAVVNGLQDRLGDATNRGNTLSAEVVQLRDTLSTLETDHSNLDAQIYVMIEENIDLELSKTVAEDHRDDLIEEVNELTMESLAKDHAFELLRQGHDEELERLQFIHSLELQREAERAESELEQTQAESRGDAARAAERAELEVSRVKAEAREAREEVSSICLLLIMPCLNVDVCPISHRCIILI